MDEGSIVLVNTRDVYNMTRSGRQRPKKTKFAYNLRRIHGASVFFVLLWNLLIFSYLQSTLSNLVKLVSREKIDPVLSTLLSITLTDCLPKLLYPFAGWLADAKMGRYKVMRYSLWLIWIGSFLHILISILRYILFDIDNLTHRTIGNYTMPFLVIIYILNAVGIAGYHVNVIPFGIDQMDHPSGENICAFLHWYYWTRNFNFGVIVQFATESLQNYCNTAEHGHPDRQAYNLVIHLIQMIFLTAALCLDFLFSSKLSKDLKIHDPVKRVRDVSVFILKHNQLVGRRKAHTYVYDTPLTRSDFAKNSYGGPFEDDEVEDVTAFWRIMVFLASSGVGGFLMQTGYFNYPDFIEHMKHASNYCSNKYIITNFVSVLTFTIAIPIHEFLIYPFFRKYIPRITLRIGLGLIVILLGLSLLLTVDVVGHHNISNYNSSTCIFYASSSGALNETSYKIVPAIVVVSIGEMLVSIAVLEFICAQSPYGMRGLIIGLYFMIYSLFMVSISTILLGFYLGFKNSVDTHLSCGTWYIMSVIVLGILGLLFYILTVNWYKKRQRGGQTNVNHQTVLEGYYER